MATVTEGSVYRTLMEQGSRCINVECDNVDTDAIEFSLETPKGDLPTEKAKCMVCGCSWAVSLTYGSLSGVFDSEGNRVQIPYHSAGRSVLGYSSFSLGGSLHIDLLYAARDLRDAMRSPGFTVDAKALALAELIKYIPDELPPRE